MPVLLAATLSAQAAPPAPNPPTSVATPAAAAQPPRRAPEPYHAVIPPWPGDLTIWPRGDAPEECRQALAEHFVTGSAVRNRFSGYPYVCTFYGAMTFALLTHDDALRDRLIAKFDPMMPGAPRREAAAPPRRRFHLRRHAARDRHPDQGPANLRSEVPRSSAQSWADRQWGPLADNTPPELPQDLHDALVKDGLSPETRLWVDDMYMLTMLQLEAYRATGDRKYLDRDAHEMVVYLDRLQQPNGLFYHAPDVKYFWGRGDGWFAAGMAEMLRTLPADHPRPPAHHGRLQADDGRAAEVSGRRTACGAN